jgi:CheY-like chemotaxis protein
MDSATKSRIFDPSFTTREPRGGNGLGLAIVHGIVISHGGGIQVESAPGQGATFRMFFPLCSSHETAPNRETYPDLVCGHGEHILYVDDEEAILRMRSILLEKIGYRITACASGQAALSYLDADPRGYDLVITDLTMPGMTGIALGRGVQSIREGLPVILCTGHNTTGRDEEMRDAGICWVLQKPVDDDVLAATIRAVLEGADGADPIGPASR